MTLCRWKKVAIYGELRKNYEKVQVKGRLSIRIEPEYADLTIMQMLSEDYYRRNTMKTYMANPDKIERKWYVVDAEGCTLGRLASEVAKCSEERINRNIHRTSTQETM